MRRHVRERHDHLLDRGVAGAFADPVDGPLHLASPGLDCGERVGNSQAEIVVTMRGDHHVVAVSLHLVHDAFDQDPVVAWSGISHSVGDVHGGGARLDGRLANRHYEIWIGAGGILWGVLDVLRVVAGSAHIGLDGRDHLFLVHAELVLHVDGDVARNT